MSFKLVLNIAIFSLPLIFFSSKAYAGYYEEGCKYFTFKQYDLAKEMFLKDIEKNDNGNSYYFLGEIEKNADNFEKAEEYLKLSIDKNTIKKYKKNAYWSLIIIQKQKGRYGDMVELCRAFWETMGEESAKKEVETIINKFMWTNNEEAKELYNTGIEYTKRKMPDKAREAFVSALQIDPYFLAPKFEIALLLLDDDNPDYAVQYLKDILYKIPFYGEVHLLLGDIYFNKQLYYYAVENLTKAADYGFWDSKTKYLIRLKIGTSYYNTGEYDKALEGINAALELNKKAVEPLIILSSIYIKKENYENALSTLLKAKDLDQNNTEIIFQIGSLYYRTGDRKYIHFFNLLLNKFYAEKKTIPQKYFKAFSLLLENNYNNKRYKDALKVIELIPENLKTYETNLISARTYYQLAGYDKAIEYFERLHLESDDRYLLSICYAQNGMTSKAKDILWQLSNLNGYLEQAKSEIAIKEIAYEIENEKNRIEEERIRNLENKKLLEQEKIEAENDDQNVLEKNNTVTFPDQTTDHPEMLQETEPDAPTEQSNDNIIESPYIEKNKDPEANHD